MRGVWGYPGRGLFVTVGAAIATLALAAAAGSVSGIPTGRYGGTDVPYEQLGGPHTVSLTINGSRVIDVSVGAGRAFCHVDSVPGEGDVTATFGAVSGLPVAKLYTENYTNGQRAYEYDVVYVRNKPGAPWTTTKSALLFAGPLYVGLDGSTQPGSSTFTQPTDGLSIQYGATAAGVFNGAGPDECYVQGALTLRTIGK
jgi:hypothetical protein